MKALFIWNNASKSYLKSILPCDIEHTLITSQYELDIANIQGYGQFIFLVELDWQNTMLQGYKLAESLVEKWDDELNPPNIQFCSFLKQEHLFELNKEIYKFYSKSFTHYYLPLTTDLSFKNYSMAKWRYLKHYALKRSGIIGRLQHDIGHLMLLSQDDLEKKVPLIRKELHRMESIIGAEAVRLYHRDYDKNLRDYLQELTQLLTIRRVELEGRQGKLHKKPLKENLPKLLLLEDNPIYAKRVEELLLGHFDVAPFDNGTEALEEIEKYAHHYSVAICDLELLKKQSKIDQEIQGIEILDHIRSNCPHIVWRVITALPRKGVKELIDVDLNRILHKNQLEIYGHNEVIEKFISDIEEQIEDNKFLLRMRGPKGRLWDATTSTGRPGGRFKNFYYDLKNSYAALFSEMWEKINEEWEEIALKQNDEIKVSTIFIRRKDEPHFIMNPKTPIKEKVEKLKTIIMHRLLFFYHFEPGDNVIYRDRNMGYNSKGFWDGDIPASPRAYAGILGISVRNLPQDNAQQILTFEFREYNQLFPEENSILKKIHKHKGLVLGDFYEKHEDACKTIFNIQYLISIDQTGPNSNFKGKYGVLIDNPFQINKDIAKQICQSLALERKLRNPSKTWKDVEEHLMDFKYGKDWDEEQMRFGTFPFRNEINKFLE